MFFTDSLKRNKDFNRVYKKGKYYVGRIIVVYILPNKTERNRLGVATVKNFGSSVLRNRCRRLVKESYRLIETDVYKGIDIVFSIRKLNGQAPNFYEVQKEMKYLLRKVGALQKRDNVQC